MRWVLLIALACVAVAAETPPCDCDVCAPGTACYNDTVAVDNGACVQLPLLVLRPHTPSGVQCAVRWASGRGLHLTARSGGHSAGCLSLNGDGVVLDMRMLKAMSWDASGMVLTAQAGLVWHEVYEFVQKRGDPSLVFPGGACPTVGIAGYLLGGGFSFLSRALGMGADNLLAMDVVYANGTLTTLSANDTDMWFAMRGSGGGNFALAVSFTLQLHRLEGPHVLFGSLCWPTSRSYAAARAANAALLRAPSKLALYVMYSSQGQFCVTVMYHGRHLSAAKPFLAPLLALQPTVDTLNATLTFYEAEALDTGKTEFPPGYGAYIVSGVFNSSGLPVDAVHALVQQAPQNASWLMPMLHTGGVIPSLAASAYPWRSSPLLYQIKAMSALGDGAGFAKMKAWAQSVRDALKPFTVGAYVNYIDVDLPDWWQQYYGPNWTRLQRIKHQVDPGNFFHSPLSIR